MVSYSQGGKHSFSCSQIQSIKQGNSPAISTFMKACEPYIEGFACKFAHPKSLNHSELVQTGRIAALHAAKCFQQDRGSFWSYVRKSIVRAIYQEGRRSNQGIRLRFWSEIGPAENCIAGRMSAEHEEFEMLDRKDALPIIQERISKWRKRLSSQKQEVIELIFFRGMNQSQAASEMKLSRARIGQIMRETLESAKICLADIAELN
jgi:RNA polymerase sigma factor (sigma-70 family)